MIDPSSNTTSNTSIVFNLSHIPNAPTHSESFSDLIAFGNNTIYILMGIVILCAVGFVCVYKICVYNKYYRSESFIRPVTSTSISSPILVSTSRRLTEIIDVISDD